MRRVSSRQRLVSWDAFDATTTSSTSPNGDDDHYDGDRHLNDDDDSSSLSDYETCYDTLPTTPTTVTTTTTTSVAAAVAAKMMNRVSSIGSNLSQEDGGISSFLKRKRASRSKLQLLESPRPSVPITTNNQDVDKQMMMSSPPPTIIPTFSWEVDVGRTSSFYSVHEEEEEEQQQEALFMTPPTTPTTSSKQQTTTTTTSTTTTANITCLPDDVQVHLLSFLAVDDVRRMTQTGRLYNRLILGADESAGLLWKNLCKQQWSYLNIEAPSNDNGTNNNNGNLELIDTLHVGGSKQQGDSGRPNLNLLLGLAASEQSVPTAVDKTLFQPKRWTRTNVSLRGGRYNMTLRSSNGPESELQERLAPNGRVAVQFVGTVGTGDRCIRANHPLPRPKLLTRSQLRQIHSQQRQHGSLYSSSTTLNNVASSTSLSSLSSSSSSSSTTPPTTAAVLCGGSFMQRLRRTSRRLASSSPYSAYSSYSAGHVKQPVWQPFVAPFYVRSSKDEQSAVVSVTPRLVAYFEVSILAAPTLTAQDAEDRRRRQQQQLQHQGVAAPWRLPAAAAAASTECVAVGLARGEFSLHTRMPGWDADSYGYHGDDGGIFHNAGHMIRPFGPKFGVGDVVGCGIDYLEQSIFYTLNGTFLGYAFDKIDKTSLEQQDLYPVVGMDTNCLVQVNFGTSGQAFQYNLDAKMDSHKQVICEALRPITNM